MIGQDIIRNYMIDLINKDSFPRFCIITGQKGSGKKILANFIAKQLSPVVVVSEGVGISQLRDLIDYSYKLIDKTVFIIPDADDMGLAAKNSMLKVLEEPPNKAYWIMTVVNLENMLPTIISRATVFHMEPYSKEELLYYAKQFKFGDDVLRICDTPGDIQELSKIGFKEFESYLKLVIDNIDKVSGSNSFKIAEKLNVKKDGEGYDLNLFWNGFKSECLERLKDNLSSPDEVTKWSSGIVITSKFQNELGITGINKSSLVDDWILTIRKKWMYGN